MQRSLFTLRYRAIVVLLTDVVSVDFARGLVNISVSDDNPLILYSGAWAISAPSGLDIDGTHHLTQDPSATAVFNFTGVAIYFLSPLWPYNVNTAISLDGSQPVIIDLVDHSRPDVGQGPETVPSHVVWSTTGLSNDLHKLVISVAPGQPYAVLDDIIYTVTETSSSNSLTLFATTSRSQTTGGASITSSFAPDATTLRSSKAVLPIALGTVLGLVGLLLLGLLVFFCHRNRRSRPASEAWTVTGDPSSSMIAPSSPSPITAAPGGYVYEEGSGNTNLAPQYLRQQSPASSMHAAPVVAPQMRPRPSSVTPRQRSVQTSYHRRSNTLATITETPSSQTLSGSYSVDLPGSILTGGATVQNISARGNRRPEKDSRMTVRKSAPSLPSGNALNLELDHEPPPYIAQ